jgi:hypothetical protein
MKRKNKSGPPVLYPDEGALTDRLVVRVSARQKELILENLGTTDIRTILLNYAKIAQSGQLSFETTAGAANHWSIQNEP